VYASTAINLMLINFDFVRYSTQF